MSKPYVVIEVSGRDGSAPTQGGHQLPEDDCRPTLHRSRDVADEEATRLTAAHPDRLFALMEVQNSADFHWV